ncbi:hypothetical protein T07_9318 [Trichinella nelsoni]|uniref:Uncharacterized protein n=1 Tax=Trichinella nelsoni TaxID=6336 RepID=A0A0V0R9Y5_9BILA|nr:hypothetical protein T07_9318 [Trichinella nelsoni]
MIYKAITIRLYAAQIIYGQITEMYFSFHELND